MNRAADAAGAADGDGAGGVALPVMLMVEQLLPAVSADAGCGQPTAVLMLCGHSPIDRIRKLGQGFSQPHVIVQAHLC